MTTISVLDETNRHGDLAEQMLAVLTEAVPGVEKVTQLQMPDTVTVRLLDIPELAKATAAFVRRQVERDTANLTLTRHQQIRADSLVKATEIAVRATWKAEASILVATSTGRPSTLITPAALEFQGLKPDTDGFCDLMVRTLAEQAQVNACAGELVPACEWPPVPPARDAVSILSGGHARWTSGEVTPLVLGRPANVQRRRAWNSKLTAATDFVLAFGQEQRIDKAAAFVGKAVAEVGPDVFNRVWVDRELLPTLDELRRPARWLKRLPT
jgi:hypothetical protein